MKPKVGIIRGKFLNKYEMQTLEYLNAKYSLTAFGSLTPFHDKFTFPVKKLMSPMDLPEFPLKMPILNRLFIDAHYLLGLESQLKGYDIAHSAETYYRYTQQCLNAKQKGYVKKVVVTVLENIAHNNEGIWGRKSFKKRTRDEADALITLTEKSKNALVTEGADSEKITVIGSGIDTERFYPKKEKKNDGITILFVGRLERYKGVFDILQAAQQVIQLTTEKKVKFLFVGNGSQEDNMISFVYNSGIEKYIKITSVPYHTIPETYRAADIFIAPSIDTPTWEEQYGYMLLEAQASGLPIITTRSGSIPEVVGDAALLVDQKNPAQIADAVMQLLENKKMRELYAKKSRERAVRVHDSRVIAEKIAKVYESLL